MIFKEQLYVHHTPIIFTMGDIDGPGDIYIVQTRQSIILNDSVFKIGRAHDSLARLRGYPKGSRLISWTPVSRMRDAEDVLKVLCRTDVLQRLDYGIEYYQGDRHTFMEKLIIAAKCFPRTTEAVQAMIHQEVELMDDDADMQQAVEIAKAVADAAANVAAVEVVALELEKPVEAIKVSASNLDATLLLHTYIHANIVELSREPVDSAVLLNNVTNMLREAGCTRGANPTLKSLSKELQRNFKTKEMISHEFPDGVRHATIFEPLVAVYVAPISKIAEFLAMHHVIRGCRITLVEGHMTLMQDFKAAFKASMGFTLRKQDKKSLHTYGFRPTFGTKRELFCKSCNGPAFAGCCEAYSNIGRTQKHVIHNMQLTLLAPR